MMRDEVLCSLDDPGEVADTELVCFQQCRGQRQPCRIGKRVRLAGGRLGHPELATPQPKTLRGWQIETKEIAAVIRHSNILTLIAATLGRASASRRASGRFNPKPDEGR